MFRMLDRSRCPETYLRCRCLIIDVKTEEKPQVFSYPEMPPCPKCGSERCRWDFSLEPATQECLNPKCEALVLLLPKKEVANHE